MCPARIFFYLLPQVIIAFVFLPKGMIFIHEERVLLKFAFGEVEADKIFIDLLLLLDLVGPPGSHSRKIAKNNFPGILAHDRGLVGYALSEIRP